MRKKIKVLYIYGDTLRYGGIEMFMMNMFRNIDRKQVQIDFLLLSNSQSPLEDEIKQHGGRIYYAPKPGRNYFGYWSALRRVFSSGEYKIVHAHCDAMNARIMRIAKRCGVPIRIAHSHNTEHLTSSSLKLLYYEFCRRLVGRFATHCWACSDAAGRWLFTEYPYTVVPNAIELEKFRFDPAKRDRLRKKLGIAETDTVLGHVGRFDYQKNHEFLIKLLEDLKRHSKRRYRLLLVGAGNLQTKIEKLCAEKNLTEDVIFTGVVTDPQDYYNAMDMFLLPSLFEGYPLVITEAQANGLPCIVSGRVTREVGLADWVRFCALELPLWSQAVEECGTKRVENPERLLAQHGFDIHQTAKQLQDTYLRLYGEAAGE